MIKLSNSKFLAILSRILLLLVIAKSISLFLLFLLPSDGVELNLEGNYQPKYQRVDFNNMLFSKASKQEIQTTNRSISQGTNISNMLLRGLYGMKNYGFIIVALKSNPNDTTIVEVGEVYSGYLLTGIASKNATFEKNSKSYILWLDLESEKTSRILNVNEKIVSQKVVTRGDISFYAKNPKQIWREISIVEVKKNGIISGFKITKIDPKSKMATLGLQKNDLIIKANNVVLKSYKDALDIYAKIKDIDIMQIVIIRNGIEEEIIYEIN